MAGLIVKSWRNVQQPTRGSLAFKVGLELAADAQRIGFSAG
jgi:hypothetical protein